MNNPIQPDHYKQFEHDPLEIAMEWGLDFPCGSAIKYIARAGKKEGNSEIQDLNKAIEFLKRKVENLEKRQRVENFCEIEKHITGVFGNVCKVD